MCSTLHLWGGGGKLSFLGEGWRKNMEKKHGSKITTSDRALERFFFGASLLHASWGEVKFLGWWMEKKHGLRVTTCARALGHFFLAHNSYILHLDFGNHAAS